MNVKIKDGGIYVELSRRNLESLLAKLNGHPPDSACTLIRHCEDDLYLSIQAVEDDAHYLDDRPPAGRMHPETEAHWMTRPKR